MTTIQQICTKKEEIRQWILEGVSERDVAALLDINYSTWRRVKAEQAELRDLVAQAKEKYKQQQELVTHEEQRKIEASLVQRALGYTLAVQKNYKMKRFLQDKDGKILFDAGGKPLTEEYLQPAKEEQHIPADVAAIKFYLMNKKKTEWQSDPVRLALDKKRVKNDTTRTKLAETAADAGENEGQSIEDFLKNEEE